MRPFLCPWMYSHDLCSRQTISAYFHVGDVARGHDCMDAGGRVTPGAVTVESEATMYMVVMYIGCAGAAFLGMDSHGRKMLDLVS